MSALGVKRTSAALLSEKEPGRERAPSRDPAVMPQHCSAGREGEKPESKRYRRSHKGVVRQLGDIRRDPPRLIGGYQGHSAGTHRKVAWGKRFSRKGAFRCILSLSLLSLLVCTFSEWAPIPAAWRYSPQSAAHRRASAVWLLIDGPQSLVARQTVSRRFGPINGPPIF